MMNGVDAFSDHDKALLRELERLRSEIGRHFPADQQISATSARRLKLLCLLDDLSTVSSELRSRRDLLETQISAADNALIAANAYQGNRPKNK